MGLVEQLWQQYDRSPYFLIEEFIYQLSQGRASKYRNHEQA